MSFLVRNDQGGIGTESGTSGAAGVERVSKRWVSFSPLEAGTAHDIGAEDGVRAERFRLETVLSAKGAPVDLGPAPTGLAMVRREHVAHRRPAALTGPWLGHIDPHHSSSDEDVSGLERTWKDNPFRVALLLACVHTPRFWALRADARSFDHLGAPETALAAATPLLRRVLRHLHRTTGGERDAWDSFVYFEMLPAHVAHLREYLGEQRARALRDGWMVREAELWMVKELHPSAPAGGRGDATSARFVGA